MLRRRDAMLRLGQYGLGALTLPGLLEAETSVKRKLAGVGGRAKSCILIFLCLCGTGCKGGGLGVGGASCAMRFSQTKDELECLVVYENLHVVGDTPADLDLAKSQLALGVSVPAVRSELFLNYLLAPLERLPWSKGTDEMILEILSQLQGGKGAFYLDDCGRLCGRDRWRIADREKFVNSINRMLCRKIEQGAAEELADRKEAGKNEAGKKGAHREWYDDETLRRWQRASRERYVWFRCEPGLLECRFPASPETCRKLGQDGEEERDKVSSAFHLEFNGVEVVFTAKEVGEQAVSLLHRVGTTVPTKRDEGLLGMALAMNGFWLAERDTDEQLEDFITGRTHLNGWLLAACLALAAIGFVAATTIRANKQIPFLPARVKVWVFTMLLLIGLPWPLLVLGLPLWSFEIAAHAYSFITIWLWVAVLGIVQATLLALPGNVNSQVILVRHGLNRPALAAGFLMGLLVFGTCISMCEVGWGPRRTLQLIPVFLPIAVAMWLVRAQVLSRSARIPNPSAAVPWPCGGLLLWSILEMLLVMGAHVAARLTTLHGGGSFTTIGLAIGMSVMLITISTTVFFWSAKRYTQQVAPAQSARSTAEIATKPNLGVTASLPRTDVQLK